jgi:hypothetical protein
MNPFMLFTDMELQRVHHALMGVVFVSELKDPTRMDLLEWAFDEMQKRMGEEE